MKKLKIMTVLGTPPEIIRLSRAPANLDEHCDHVLVYTGQKYCKPNHVFFNDFGVRKTDYFLGSAAAASGAARTISNLIIGVGRVLEEVQREAEFHV